MRKAQKETMSNIDTAVNPTTSANASVVLNNIIVSGVGLSITATESAADPASTTAKEVGTVVLLQKLISELKQWEAGAYRTSNEQLYALLQRIYNFYRSVSGTDNKLKQEQLLNFCIAQGYRFTKSSHLITKVVRCVFEDKAMDRRRVSTYLTKYLIRYITSFEERDHYCGANH
jgi:hypothetical protein